MCLSVYNIRYNEQFNSHKNNDNDNDDDDIVLFKQIWILREPLFKRTFCLKRGWCVNGT